METKHFSHHHPLLFHQVPQGSQAHCSGCKSPASGNVYACWQCSYFLHDQCFRAARSLNHPSHPLHPLTLVPFPTYPSASFFCNTCSLAGDGFSYSCPACEFDVHLHCALNPINPNQQNYHNPPPPHPQNHAYPPPPPQNPVYPPQPQPQPQHTGFTPAPNIPFPDPTPANPPTGYPQPNPTPHNYAPQKPSPPPNPIAPVDSTVVNATPNYNNPPPAQPSAPQAKPPSIIKHFSHPHVLKQMEVAKEKAKVCSACECELSGAAYCCTESYCTFNLHKICFDAPREVKHKCHLQHPLTLLTAPPYNDGFTCNACLKDGKAFAYNCAACSYDLHIDCVQWPDTVTRPDHSHSLTLYYSSPAVDQASEEAFMCNVCKNPVHEMAWLYYCRECDFGTHLECVASGIQQQSQSGGAKSEEELLREVELKFAVLQILLGAETRKAALQLWD